MSKGGQRCPLILKASPVTIAYGQEVTGHLDFADDYEDWKFAGTAGDTVTIHTTQDGGVSLHPGLKLFDPSNTLVAQGDPSSSQYSDYYIKNYQLSFSGVYTIRVYGGSTTGGYKLSLALIP